MLGKLSFKNVLRNKRRTAITVTVIAMGVSMLILALSYVEYIKWGLRESTIHGQTGHFQIITKDSVAKEEEKTLQYGVEGWTGLRKKIQTIEQVQVVTPRINFSGLASTGEKSIGILVSAVIPQNEIILGGNFIDPDPLQKLTGKDDGILLARGLTKLLNARVGTVVTILTTTADGALNAMDFRMLGTIAVDAEEMDKRYAVLTLNGAQYLLGTKKVETILVGLHNTEDLPVALKKAKTILNQTFAFNLWHEISPYYDKVLGFFYQIIGFLIFVLMMIVWFSTINTVLMSILERSSELATLRAMGSSKSRVMKILFTEGIWIGLIGVIIGILLELTCATIINHANIMIPPPPGQSQGYPLMVKNVLDNFIFVSILIISVVLCSTILPSMKTSRLNIAKALRSQ